MVDLESIKTLEDIESEMLKLPVEIAEPAWRVNICGSGSPVGCPEREEFVRMIQDDPWIIELAIEKFKKVGWSDKFLRVEFARIYPELVENVR